jgi:RND family efflux transporter MFP subunit
MKGTIAVVIALAVVAVGLLAWRSGVGIGLQKRGGAAVAVEVSPVETATIRDAATFTGSVVPRFQFTVAPKIAGRLRKLTVNIGDRVKQGDLVVLLEDDEYAQALEQARAGLAVARATVEQAESSLAAASRELERAKELRSKKIASESELDTAQTRCEAEEARAKVAVAQVAQSEAALKAAEVRLAYTRIHASWEGGSDVRSVGERFVDEGAMLRANDPVVSIIDIDTVIAVIHVIERDYSSISMGQEAVVTADAFPERAFAGRVVRIAPILKETSRQARVEIEVVNPGLDLKPGMFVRAGIVFDTHENATVVPVSALVKRDGREGVFVVEEDTGAEAGPVHRARFVPIRTGIVDGGLAEVLEPELSGVVVTLGQHLIEDGAPVILPESDRPASPSAAPPGGHRRGDSRPGGHP